MIFLQYTHITSFSPESKHENDGGVTFYMSFVLNLNVKVIINYRLYKILIK